MPVWLAHLPSVAIPMCIDQPPAFVAYRWPAVSTRRLCVARIKILHDGAMQTSQKCLPHPQRLSPLQQPLLCAFQTCQPAFSRLWAVADAGCFARTSQAGAPTSDNHNGAFAVTASVVCNFTTLDCLGVPALSLTDDEQSPSWWCPGLTAHIQDALNCAANMAIENRFGSDCPRNGRTPL